MTLILFTSILTLKFALAAEAPDNSANGFTYVDSCTMGKNWHRVQESERVKGFLKGFSRNTSQNLQVYSCYRSQESQNAILRRNNCRPFGPVECSGRIAANQSEHTLGAAADFKLNSGHSSIRNEAKILGYCKLLDKTRKQFAGGRGGITIYGIGPDGVAFFHYDGKDDWRTWGGCEEAMGEGHCKRSKYGAKEARLEGDLNAAKLAKAKEQVAKLESELAKMRADCPPGDLTCRDSFKD